MFYRRLCPKGCQVHWHCIGKADLRRGGRDGECSCPPPRNREMTTASNKRGFSRCALACQFFSIGQSTVRVRILLLYQYYSVYRIILVFGRCRRGPRKQSLQFHAAVACLLFTISEHFYRTMQHHLFYFLLLSWSSLYQVNFGWAEWRVGRYHTR